MASGGNGADPHASSGNRPAGHRRSATPPAQTRPGGAPPLWAAPAHGRPWICHSSLPIKNVGRKIVNGTRLAAMELRPPSWPAARARHRRATIRPAFLRRGCLRPHEHLPVRPRSGKAAARPDPGALGKPHAPDSHRRQAVRRWLSRRNRLLRTQQSLLRISPFSLQRTESA